MDGIWEFELTVWKPRGNNAILELTFIILLAAFIVLKFTPHARETMSAPQPAVSRTPNSGGRTYVQPAARKQWDKSEWEAKAKAKDTEFAEKAKAAEAAMAQGGFYTLTGHSRIQLDEGRG